MSWSKFLDPLGLFKVKRQPVTPPEEFDSTTAEEGGVIGVLWGTRDITTKNITAWLDVSTTAIKSKGGKK
jgi:hypothetical protein